MKRAKKRNLFETRAEPFREPPGTNPGTNAGTSKPFGSFSKPPSPHAEQLRRNGSLSHGPKTPSGKITSSRNAIRHGLSSTNVVLPTEDPAAWDAHRAGINASLKPRTYMESWFAERIALEMWRLDRAARVERAIAASQMRLDEARREAGSEGEHVAGSVTSKSFGGEKYRLVLLNMIADLEKQITAFLEASQDGSVSVAFDADLRNMLCVACTLSPDEMGAATCGDSTEEMLAFLGRIAQAMEPRLGRKFDIRQMFEYAVNILRGSVNDVRDNLTEFDRNVIACLERKALPEVNRLDLLLRYEGAASRNLSRLLTEYRALRAESDPIEGAATEKLSPTNVTPLRAVKG